MIEEHITVPHFSVSVPFWSVALEGSAPPVKHGRRRLKHTSCGLRGGHRWRKSSLVTAFQRWSRFLETEVLAVKSLGAERVHYDAEFDVRDMISLTEVEYDLGERRDPRR